MSVKAVAVAEIASYIDALLNIAQFEEDEGGNGLMVDAGQPVSRIAAAVNTSFASIRGAADAEAQLLIVHHATWEGIDLTLKPAKEQALQNAGVSLYGAHALAGRRLTRDSELRWGLTMLPHRAISAVALAGAAGLLSSALYA